MEKSPGFHGSDLEAAAAFYQLSPDEVVRFGANVNPLGFPESVKQILAGRLDVLGAYPDRDYRALRQAIAGYCRADMEHIIVGNGSTELISLLIQARKARHALVIAPTYSEYDRELGLNGGDIDYFYLLEEEDFVLDAERLSRKIREGYDFVILCNPNNPTSSAVKNGDIVRILDVLTETGGFLMIDETYVEFAPDPDAVTSVPLTGIYANLMVLRGVSKFFAAPGLRLGYGITGSPSLMKELHRLQNPWSLSSIGALAGELLFQDKDYIRRSRTLITKERERMYQALLSMPGFHPFPPSANFILVRLEKPGLTSAQVFDALMRRKMMIRDCSSFQSLGGEYIRFCIMLPEDNTRLLLALSTL